MSGTNLVPRIISRFAVMFCMSLEDCAELDILKGLRVWCWPTLPSLE
jgi:hypothetical protein